jgi:hypothetical protein
MPSVLGRVLSGSWPSPTSFRTAASPRQEAAQRFDLPSWGYYPRGRHPGNRSKIATPILTRELALPQLESSEEI